MMLLCHGSCRQLGSRRLLQDGSHRLRTGFPFLARPCQSTTTTVSVSSVIHRTDGQDGHSWNNRLFSRSSQLNCWTWRCQNVNQLAGGSRKPTESLAKVETEC